MRISREKLKAIVQLLAETARNEAEKRRTELLNDKKILKRVQTAQTALNKIDPSIRKACSLDRSASGMIRDLVSLQTPRPKNEVSLKGEVIQLAMSVNNEAEFVEGTKKIKLFRD